MILIFLTIFTLFLLTFIRPIQNARKAWKYGKNLPGPKAHPILGNVPSLISASTEELWKIFTGWAEENRKNGSSIMRFFIMGKLYIWPLNGKALAAIVDSSTEINKGDDYNFFSPWLGGGLLLEGFGERWKSHRKMLTPAFHFAKLQGYFEVFNSESKIMIEILDDFAASEETVDLFPFIKRCALDIICQTAMGTKIDAQINHDHRYVQAVEGYNKMGVIYSFNPWLKNPILFALLGYRSKYYNYLSTLKSFTNKVIQERRSAISSGEVEKEKSKRMMNFLDLLLSMEESNILSEEDIRQEVDTFMFAGHDTTTSSTSWACWNLAHHPDVQQKVYEEILEIIGDDPQVDITLENVNNLNYLDRVLKESKRLIPPVPATQRKLKNDLIIDGYLIPAGGNVSISPLVLHNNSSVFKNPEKFDPDRFLPEQIAKRHPYDFIPFSAGIRNCIGQKFAQLNEKVLISQIVRNFRIVPMKKFDETLPCVEVVTKPSNGIPVKLIRRNF